MVPARRELRLPLEPVDDDLMGQEVSVKVLERNLLAERRSNDILARRISCFALGCKSAKRRLNMMGVDSL